MTGWISLHRSIQKHWLFGEERKFSRFEAWIDLLLEANHDEGKTMVDGKLVIIKRGENLTSLRKLSARWNWSITKTNKFLEVLEEDDMIELKKDTKKTVVTIVNYDSYQDLNVEKRHRKKTEVTQKKNRKDTEKKQKETNNNVNNDLITNNNDNKSTSRSKLKFETPHLELAKLLFREMKKNNPNAKEPNMEKWANEFRLMMERDKRQGKDIQDLIIFSQKDDFWYKVILSPGKLRDKFDTLTLQSAGRGNKKESATSRSDKLSRITLDDL